MVDTAALLTDLWKQSFLWGIELELELILQNFQGLWDVVYTDGEQFLVETYVGGARGQLFEYISCW